MHQQLDNHNGPSVLRRLRSGRPPRPLRLREAMQVAELQAARLLELHGIAEAPVPTEVVTSLPRIVVEYDANLPASVSGCSDWDNRRAAWVISINPREPQTRRRFTLLHEYKHIIDHGSAGLASVHLPSKLTRDPNEYLADYFAGCVLMPRRLVKSAWGHGVQAPADLAHLFDVSVRAIEVRLAQLGLGDRQQPSTTTTVEQGQPRRGRRSHDYFRLNSCELIEGTAS